MEIDKAISTQALGSEEVTNGDFSAAGINLVDNPNFTDTGIELITDGAFPTGTTAWIINGLTTISGDAANLTADSSVNNYIFQNTLGTNTNSGSFVLSYEITANTIIGDSATALDTSSGGAIITGSLKVLPTTIGSHEVYFISKATGTNSQLQLRTRTTATGGSLSITNISVKELGEDWTAVGTSSISIGTHEGRDDVADININATNNGISIDQPFTYVSGKSYKVVAEVYVVSGSFRIDCLNQYVATDFVSTTTTGSWQTLTGYITAIDSGSNYIWLRSLSEISHFYVDSVSVQELGEGWNLNAPPWSVVSNAIASDGTSAADANQSLFPTIGKSYKIVYTIASISSGGYKIGFGGVISSFDTTVGTYTKYITAIDDSGYNARLRITPDNSTVGTVTNISVKEIATSYLTQDVSLSAKTWKIIYSVSDYLAGSVSATDYGVVTTANAVGITEYVEIGAISDFRMVNIDGYFEGAVTGISAQLVDPNDYWTLNGWVFGEDKASNDGVNTGNLNQDVGLQQDKSYLIKGTISNYNSGTLQVRLGLGATIDVGSSDGTFSIFLKSTSTNSVLRFYPKVGSLFNGSVTNISVEQVDPNDYWTLGTGWSIGTDKAISTVTGSNSDITQSILTAGKTYRTVYEIVDYDAGTAQAIVTGSEGADAVALGTYTEDLTTTGTDFSIRSKLGTFDGAVSSVSVKQLGTYEDQSIYVTAADVQTIAQASVYYLIELTSMGSKNSLYFLPSSVVPNNGRYTKLNFTVISKDAIQQPTEGIISFYDSVGGLDTYPMGFYEFRIYEQTSSTNLDPLLATGLLEKGFAFVRDFSGNMQELTDGFKEYNPALTQYVYSK